jgi:Cu/Zn superoxide dismutase
MTRWQWLAGPVLGCALLTALVPAPLAGAQEQTLTVTLNSQNNSGISGTATFTDLGGGRTRVAIQASGAGPGPEPAHIHPGTCAQLDPTPAFTLTNVTNGSSTTDVSGSLQQLTSAPYAVHMHKSLDELTVYVACADITAGGAQPATLPRSGDLSEVPTAAAVAGVGLLLAGFALRRRGLRA